MFKKLLIVLILLAISVSVFAENGLDDQDNPNDPATNDRANACFDGGTMANKCESTWEWVCGWYMIRLDTGIFSREEIPASCASLLPAEIVTEVVVPPVVIDMNCYIQVGPTEFEQASSAVLGGADSGNFYWNSPTGLANLYSGWQIWFSGTWYVGFYGDCSPLGIGAPAPTGLNIIP